VVALSEPFRSQRGGTSNRDGIGVEGYNASYLAILRQVANNFPAPIRNRSASWAAHRLVFCGLTLIWMRNAGGRVGLTEEGHGIKAAMTRAFSP
jgi:hypothetical protein